MNIREAFDKIQLKKSTGKYRNKPKEVDGIKFQSQKEADYYTYLKNCEDVSFFLRQVPFDLPGKIRYFCDFAVFYGSGSGQLYRTVFVDIKGYQTPVFKIKKKQVESLYNITIELL